MTIRGGDQTVLAGKVVVDEADRHLGLGADAANGQALVAVPLQALDGRLDQRPAPLLRQLALEAGLAGKGRHRIRVCLRHAPQPSPPEIGEDFPRGIVTRCASHTAPRVRPRPAHVKPLQRTAIITVAEHGTR